MAAHLPFPIRENEEGIKLVNFHDAVQYCVRQSRKNQRIATSLKVISAVGSTIILFLLGFWSADPQRQSTNMYIMLTGKVLALIVSMSSSLNYLFDFQRKANKFDSARRVIGTLDASYKHAVKGKLAAPSYLDNMEDWSRNNFTQIENLLDNDKVYDVGMHFKVEALPRIVELKDPVSGRLSEVQGACGEERRAPDSHALGAATTFVTIIINKAIDKPAKKDKGKKR